jgi:hypothetical protein
MPGTKFLMASTNRIFEAPKDRQVLIDGNISRCVAFLNPSQSMTVPM